MHDAPRRARPLTVGLFLVAAHCLAAQYTPTANPDTLAQRLHDTFTEATSHTDPLLGELTDPPFEIQRLLFSPTTVEFARRLRQTHGYRFDISDYPQLIDLPGDTLVIKAIFDPATVDFYRRHDLEFLLSTETSLAAAVLAHSVHADSLLTSLRTRFSLEPSLRDGKLFVNVLGNSADIAALLDTAFATRLIHDLLDPYGFEFSLWDIAAYRWLLADTSRLASLRNVIGRFAISPDRFDLGEFVDAARDSSLLNILMSDSVLAAYNTLHTAFGLQLHPSAAPTLQRLTPHIGKIVHTVKALEEAYGYRFSVGHAKELIYLANSDSLRRSVLGKEVIGAFQRLDSSCGCEFSIHRLAHLKSVSDSDMRACIRTNDSYLWQRLSMWPRWEVVASDHDALTSAVTALLSGKQRRRRSSLQVEGYHQNNDLRPVSCIDLVKVGLALEWLDRPGSTEWVGQQMSQDIANPFSESGGTFFADSTGGVFPTILPSLDAADSLVANNVRYRWPDEIRTAKSLFNIHFHARDHDESEHAGPSSGVVKGDLAAARSMGIDGVVLTKLSGGWFNADFYDDRGHVVDLGVYAIENWTAYHK